MHVTKIIDKVKTIQFFDGATLVEDFIKENLHNVEVDRSDPNIIIVTANNYSGTQRLIFDYRSVTVPAGLIDAADLRFRIIEMMQNDCCSSAEITQIDEVSGSISYIGNAAPGSGDNDPVWTIRKIEKIGNVTSVKYGAEVHTSKPGMVNRTNKWSQRDKLEFT